MNRWALIENGLVNLVTEQNQKPEIDGVWVQCADSIGPGWTYDGAQFHAPPVVDPPTPPKTEEEKLAEATAAAIAKLIADGVLKQA
jgi:hypothetical protein